MNFSFLVYIAILIYSRLYCFLHARLVFVTLPLSRTSFLGFTRLVSAFDIITSLEIEASEQSVTEIIRIDKRPGPSIEKVAYSHMASVMSRLDLSVSIHDHVAAHYGSNQGNRVLPLARAFSYVIYSGSFSKSRFRLGLHLRHSDE